MRSQRRSLQHFQGQLFMLAADSGCGKGWSQKDHKEKTQVGDGSIEGLANKGAEGYATRIGGGKQDHLIDAIAEQGQEE